MSSVIHIIDDTTLPGVPRPAKKSDFAGGPGGGSLTNEQLRESPVPVTDIFFSAGNRHIVRQP
jgi:hypothetical protein